MIKTLHVAIFLTLFGASFFAYSQAQYHYYWSLGGEKFYRDSSESLSGSYMGYQMCRWSGFPEVNFSTGNCIGAKEAYSASYELSPQAKQKLTERSSDHDDYTPSEFDDDGYCQDGTTNPRCSLEDDEDGDGIPNVFDEDSPAYNPDHCTEFPASSICEDDDDPDDGGGDGGPDDGGGGGVGGGGDLPVGCETFTDECCIQYAEDQCAAYGGVYNAFTSGIEPDLTCNYECYDDIPDPDPDPTDPDDPDPTDPDDPDPTDPEPDFPSLDGVESRLDGLNNTMTDGLNGIRTQLQENQLANTNALGELQAEVTNSTAATTDGFATNAGQMEQLIDVTKSTSAIISSMFQGENIVDTGGIGDTGGDGDENYTVDDLNKGDVYLSEHMDKFQPPPPTATCPESISINLTFGQFEINTQPICDLAAMIRFLVVASAYMFAALIVVRSF